MGAAPPFATGIPTGTAHQGGGGPPTQPITQAAVPVVANQGSGVASFTTPLAPGMALQGVFGPPMPPTTQAAAPVVAHQGSGIAQVWVQSGGVAQSPVVVAATSQGPANSNGAPGPVVPLAAPTVALGAGLVGRSPLTHSPLIYGSASPTIAPPAGITWHIPAETREKICRGEFVDVFDLIDAGVVPERAELVKRVSRSRRKCGLIGPLRIGSRGSRYMRQ